MRRITRSLLALALGAMSLSAQASWPERSVKFIVPFPAGGPADSAMRIVAKRLGEIWGQPTIVENRPGAPGMVVAATAAPDGYTMILGAGSHMVTAPLINAKLAYKPQRDFAPVSLLLTNTPVLTVHPSLGVRSLRELIAYAKAKPDTLNYSSAGIGSPSHLMMEMFNDITGTKMVHVPYKGGAPSVLELVAGHVQLGVNATPTVLTYVTAGKLTPIAVASAKRDRSLPSVPTMAEAGIPNFDYLVWYGVFAPIKTPLAVVEKVSADMQKVLGEPEIVEQMRAQGADPQGSSPKNFATMVQNDINVWGKLIREKKLTLNE
jgi:tripartite-type tricarboxylate transporter receptor subunit TctC